MDCVFDDNGCKVLIAISGLVVRTEVYRADWTVGKRVVVVGVGEITINR